MKESVDAAVVTDSAAVTDVAAAISEFVELTRAKRALIVQQLDIQQRRDALAAVIIDDFRRHDRQAVNQGGMTIYLARNVAIRSRTNDTADIVARLRRARLGELIGLNWPRLKAWIKERLYDPQTDTWEVDDRRLPPSIREVIQVDEFFRLHYRTS